MKYIWMLFFVAISCHYVSADTPAAPPPPSNPEIPVSLNNRTYLDTSTVYDPTYGIGRVGIVNDRVVAFLPFRLIKNTASTGNLLSRNFQVFTYNSEAGKSGNLKIPIIGSFSASGSDILHIVMEDISEVYLDKGYRPSACELWSSINHSLIKAGDVLIYTDHAVLTTMSYGAASKQDAKGQVGIGNYFSAGADIYKSADVTTKVPLIAVDGIKIKIADPKTFCTPRGDRRVEAFSNFTTLEDLGTGPLVEFKTFNDLSLSP